MKMGGVKSRFKRQRSSVKSKRKSIHSQKEEETSGPKVVLFTGYSHKMNLSFALHLAEDPLGKFKVLVTMPSLASSEYLADSRVLNLLNKTLFVLQMEVDSDESVKGVLREIMENDGFIDAVGEFLKYCTFGRLLFSRSRFFPVCLQNRFHLYSLGG